MPYANSPFKLYVHYNAREMLQTASNGQYQQDSQYIFKAVTGRLDGETSWGPHEQARRTTVTNQVALPRRKNDNQETVTPSKSAVGRRIDIRSLQEVAFVLSALHLSNKKRHRYSSEIQFKRNKLIIPATAELRGGGLGSSVKAGIEGHAVTIPCTSTGCVYRVVMLLGSLLCSKR